MFLLDRTTALPLDCMCTDMTGFTQIEMQSFINVLRRLQSIIRLQPCLVFKLYHLPKMSRGGKEPSICSWLLYFSRVFRYLYFTGLFIFLTTFYFNSLHLNTIYLDFLLLTCQNRLVTCFNLSDFRKRTHDTQINDLFLFWCVWHTKSVCIFRFNF